MKFTSLNVMMLAAVAALCAPMGRAGEPSDAPATSVLEGFRSVSERMGNGELFDWLAGVDPKLASLTLAGGAAAEDDSVERLRAELRGRAGLISDVVALSKRKMEAIPTPTYEFTAEDPAPWLRHPNAWIRRSTLLLVGDMRRAWDDGDFDGTAVRLIACWNIAAECALNANVGGRMTIGLSVCIVSTRTFFGAGLLERVPAARAEELLRAIGRLNLADPFGHLDAWRTGVEQRVVLLKADLSGPDAGAKLAAEFEESGIATLNDEPVNIDIGVNDRSLRESLKLEMVYRSKAVVVRGLSAWEIGERIDSAAALIPDIDAAIRSENPREAIAPLKERIGADPTHISRHVLLAPGMITDLAVSFRRDIAGFLETLERRVP